MEEQSTPTQIHRPKVLLVDDEESILNSLRRLLRGQPYDVLLATSGAQALEMLEQQPVDLVMSDARMPNMDGASLLAHVRQRYPATVRIMLTGYADPTAIIKAINDGQIHRYISKPWNDEELLLILRQSLEHQHSEQERQRLERLTQAQNDQLKLLKRTQGGQLRRADFVENNLKHRGSLRRQSAREKRKEQRWTRGGSGV